MSWNERKNDAYSADLIWCITLVLKRSRMHKSDWSEMVKDIKNQGANGSLLWNKLVLNVWLKAAASQGEDKELQSAA